MEVVRRNHVPVDIIGYHSLPPVWYFESVSVDTVAASNYNLITLGAGGLDTAGRSRA